MNDKSFKRDGSQVLCNTHSQCLVFGLRIDPDHSFRINWNETGVSWALYNEHCSVYSAVIIPVNRSCVCAIHNNPYVMWLILWRESSYLRTFRNRCGVWLSANTIRREKRMSPESAHRLLFMHSEKDAARKRSRCSWNFSEFEAFNSRRDQRSNATWWSWCMQHWDGEKIAENKSEWILFVKPNTKQIEHDIISWFRSTSIATNVRQNTWSTLERCVSDCFLNFRNIEPISNRVQCNRFKCNVSIVSSEQTSNCAGQRPTTLFPIDTTKGIPYQYRTDRFPNLLIRSCFVQFRNRAGQLIAIRFALCYASINSIPDSGKRRFCASLTSYSLHFVLIGFAKCEESENEAYRPTKMCHKKGVRKCDMFSSSIQFLDRAPTIDCKQVRACFQKPFKWSGICILNERWCVSVCVWYYYKL